MSCKPKVLTEADVTFTVTCCPEDIQIEGNASAIDPETDAETYRWIRDQLDRGNEWAWCCIKVTASYAGLEESDVLGGCSYRSEKGFREPGGYFDDMKREALRLLQEQVDALAPMICVEQ